MNTGALRHYVTLDEPNGANGYAPLNPPDWYCATLSEGEGRAVFTGRYHPGITTNTRVHFKGRLYHVTGIQNRQERDVELVLTCAELFD